MEDGNGNANGDDEGDWAEDVKEDDEDEDDDDASNSAIFNPRRSSHDIYGRGMDGREEIKGEDEDDVDVTDDVNRGGRLIFD